MRRVTDTRFGIRALAGLLCLALSSVSASAVTGYSVFHDRDLVTVDLATGAVEVIGDLAIGAVAEVALYGDDLFVVAQSPATSSLYRVDLATATETLVGDLGTDLRITGLTFDAGGTLWMSATDALYTVDPASAAKALIGAPDRPLLALAARGSVLYGLTSDETTTALVLIDPDTAATAVTAELPELSFSGGLLAGMAFDPRGSLWAYVVTLPPVIPHILLQTFFRIGDPTDPQAVKTFSLEAPFISGPPLYAGLVVAPGIFDAVVEIPTLGRVGWTLFAALLFGAGLSTIRRLRAAG